MTIETVNKNFYTRPENVGFLPEQLFLTFGDGTSDTPIFRQQAIYLDIVASLHGSPTPNPSFWTAAAIRTAKREAVEMIKNLLWTPGIVVKTRRPDALEVYYRGLEALDNVLMKWKPELEKTVREHYPEYDEAYPADETATATN